MAFVKEYNERTASQVGDIVPALLTVFEDNSFTFETKTPPASALLLKAAGIEKGSGNPLAEKVATIPAAKVQEIAERKMDDLNATDLDAAIRIVAGTARSMGITVEDL